MFIPRTDNWDGVRQSFADQFEQDGSYFIYRRSQKGEAIRVSADERSKFIEEFDRNLRRATWIIYVGVTVVLGGTIGLSLLKGIDVSRDAILLGFGLGMFPYFAFYRWAWAAPTRALRGRTPVAGERPSEEVRRIQFQRISYGQLAAAAFGGVMFPFIGSSRQNIFSGWDVFSGRNSLWLVCGGALVLLAAVQAFRKWRFEQADSSKYIIRLPSVAAPEPAQEAAPASAGKLQIYAPLAVIVLGLAFIGYTSAGKQLTKQPSFGAIVLVACGCWSLITVARGYAKGEIEPFMRGFYNTYDREKQPKPFWASMAWNGMFGCFCIWIAVTMSRDARAQLVQDRCYNEGRRYQPNDAFRACNQLLSGQASLGGWSRADVFVERGIASYELRRTEAAIADYTRAISLQPRDSVAYCDRALAYEQVGNLPSALHDYTIGVQQDSRQGRCYFQRGLVYLKMRRWDAAIDDFTRSHDLDPKNAWPLANRGLAYAWKSDAVHAKQDFAATRAIDPQNPVLLHGEGLMYMFGGNLDAAIARFSAALANDPKDFWSLQMRADAYQQMGAFEQARADRAKLAQLRSSANARNAPTG